MQLPPKAGHLTCCKVPVKLNRKKEGIFINSSFPVFLNCSRESREVPEFIVPTLIEKTRIFLADRGSAKDGLKL